MGTAGLARFLVSGYRRVPAPPPRITAADGAGRGGGGVGALDSSAAERGTAGHWEAAMPRSPSHAALTQHGVGLGAGAALGQGAGLLLGGGLHAQGPAGWGVGAGARPVPLGVGAGGGGGRLAASAPARLPTFPGPCTRGAGAGRLRPGEAGASPNPYRCASRGALAARVAVCRERPAMLCRMVPTRRCSRAPARGALACRAACILACNPR